MQVVTHNVSQSLNSGPCGQNAHFIHKSGNRFPILPALSKLFYLQVAALIAYLQRYFVFQYYPAFFTVGLFTVFTYISHVILAYEQ